MESCETPKGGYAGKKFQIYLIFMCWFVYTFAQLGRFSYNANTTLIMDKFLIDHKTVGLPVTFFFFAYGIGQIFVGIVCKAYNKRAVVTLSLIASAAVNFAIFFEADFVVVKYLWLINGFAQAHLWPVLLLTLRENVEPERLPFVAIVMSTASTGGRFIAIGVCAVFAIDAKIFTYSFLVASVAMFAMAVMWFFSSARLKKDASAANAGIRGGKAAKTDVGAIILIAVLGLFSMIAYAVSGGLQQWMPSILKDNYGIIDWIAILSSVLLPLFMLSDSIIANFMYKKFPDFVLLSSFVFAIGAALIGATLAFLNVHWMPLVVLFVLECITMGVETNMTTVQAPLLLEGKINAGFIAGFLNGCCYIGSAISSYVLGSLADDGGWSGAFVLLIVLSAFCAVIAAVYVAATKRKRESVK